MNQPPIRTADSWSHQCDAYAFAVERPASLLYMGMGCGKTKVVCDLLVNWQTQAALILCPRSVIGVWRREFARWTTLGDAVLALDDGTGATKLSEAQQHLRQERPAVLALNYETARTPTWSKWLTSQRWGAVVLDESHRAKAPWGVTSRLVSKLSRHADRRLCLTGTPMPHSPGDIFAQYRFLEPEIFGWSWTAFRSRYAVLGGFQGRQIVRWQNLDELHERIYRVAYHVGRDVLDLPDAQHVEIPIVLPPAAKKTYRDLERDFIAEVDGGVVTAANALVKLIRLRQATSGFAVLDETGEVRELHSAKLGALYDLVDGLPPEEPVVVFCDFRRDLDAAATVAEMCGRTYGELSGRRNDLTDHGRMPVGVGLMAVQVQSGGVGIDLTAARYAVYYSVAWSLGNYDQSLARLHRPGQSRSVTYYHLVAAGSVDERVYKAFRDKREIVEFVLRSYQNQEREHEQRVGVAGG